MERLIDGRVYRINPLTTTMRDKIPKERLNLDDLKPKPTRIRSFEIGNDDTDNGNTNIIDSSAVDESDDDWPPPNRRLRYNSSHVDLAHNAPAHIYYGDEHAIGTTAKGQARSKNRTMSFSVLPSDVLDLEGKPRVPPKKSRRMSHDEPTKDDNMFIVHVDETLKRLLHGEDTDDNHQITIFDTGPKSIWLGTAGSAGHRKVEIRGTRYLGNLLQELTNAKDYSRGEIVLHESRLKEPAAERLTRMIKTSFWQSLTRRIEGANIGEVAKDAKDRTANPQPRVYVPDGCKEQLEYYQKLARDLPQIGLQVCSLPPSKNITAEYVKSLNDKPGILALDMHMEADELTGELKYRGKPFVVPGGRFNELYGWDSYMESLGLIKDGHVHLAKSMVENFIFCINHYGKILNANRTYYLARSQPPFLTDMALRVYDVIKHEAGAKDWLRQAILAAMKEYHTVWMAEPRLDRRTGLSRYRPDGLGIPPETEASHFEHLLEPYAKKHGISIERFTEAYNDGTIKEPQLDDYFLHDRAVRESGHDTSYRLEGVCANLATVDLNCLLYKYEKDIENVLQNIFKNQFTIPEEWCVLGQVPNQKETSHIWTRRAKIRKAAIDKYLWNKEKSMYFDYDTVKQQRTTYESATTFWAMWAMVSDPYQAGSMMRNALPKLEMLGGLAAGTLESRGETGLDRPNRQWDYPFGWAPQQILAWQGLRNYGYIDDASRLAYRWLYMITKSFMDFNGIVVEKYDVTQRVDPHRVEAEYGNQGADFKGVPREGFGWVNASYQVGLEIITSHMRVALSTPVEPEVMFSKLDQMLDGDTEIVY